MAGSDHPAAFKTSKADLYKADSLVTAHTLERELKEQLCLY